MTHKNQIKKRIVQIAAVLVLRDQAPKNSRPCISHNATDSILLLGGVIYSAWWTPNRREQAYGTLPVIRTTTHLLAYKRDFAYEK